MLTKITSIDLVLTAVMYTTLTMTKSRRKSPIERAVPGSLQMISGQSTPKVIPIRDLEWPRKLKNVKKSLSSLNRKSCKKLRPSRLKRQSSVKLWISMPKTRRTSKRGILRWPNELQISESRMFYRTSIRKKNTRASRWAKRMIFW